MKEKYVIKDLVDIKIHGIKCDMPLCGWADMTVQFEKYSEYVNKPCPKCGSNLLTASAHAQCRKIVLVGYWLNKLGRGLQHIGLLRSSGETKCRHAIYGIDGELKGWKENR